MNKDSKIRILSVEDDADSRELLEFVLSDYEVIFAEDSESALRLLKKDKFQLCLLDGWLSDGSGVDLCVEIRKVCGNTPIVFASGAAQQKDIDCAIEAGAQAYLIKPYYPEHLQKIVKELIQ